MKKMDVNKLARVLRVLVIIVFVCNLIALFFVPLMAVMADYRGSGGLEPFSPAWFELYTFLLLLAWNPSTFRDPYSGAMILFLTACGVCTAIILWQGKRVLDTIIRGNPFVPENAGNLKRAAVCCFVISGAALARLVWSVCYYRSPAPLATYNALFVPIFLMAGLLCMVMSALFRQASELKEENDLTI